MVVGSSGGAIFGGLIRWLWLVVEVNETGDGMIERGERKKKI